eukprot:jgi/Orpsp1_1/1179935/evm.model.c7180000071437.1
MQNISSLSNYLEKQRKFISLVKDVQDNLTSKKYLKQEAYRYLLCAKVIDQLEEFEIKPSYETLCKALYNVVKNPIQMKLLWATILKETGNRPYCINSTHVNYFWKELCMNKKYSNICQSDDDIMFRIEKSLCKFSNEKKHRQLKELNQLNQIKQIKSIKEIKQERAKLNNTKVSNIPSPALSEASIIAEIFNQVPVTENSNINNYNTATATTITTTTNTNTNILSPPITYNEIPLINPSQQYSLNTTPSPKCVFCVPSQNEVQYPYEMPLINLQQQVPNQYNYLLY